MEEHKGQDVLSGAGVAAVGRAVFMQVCWDGSRERNPNYWVSSAEGYLTAASPCPHCSWEQGIGQEGYRTGLLLIETLTFSKVWGFFLRKKNKPFPALWHKQLPLALLNKAECMRSWHWWFLKFCLKLNWKSAATMMLVLGCVKLQTLEGRDACLWDEFLHSDNWLSQFPAWLCESGPSVSSFLWWQINAEKTDGGNLKWETFPAVGEAELDRFTVCLILFRSDAFLKCFSLCMWYFGIRLFPRCCVRCWERELKVSAQVHREQLYLKTCLKVGGCFTPALTFEAWGKEEIRKMERELTQYPQPDKDWRYSFKIAALRFDNSLSKYLLYSPWLNVVFDLSLCYPT